MDEGHGRLEVQVEMFSGETEVTLELIIYTLDDSATGTEHDWEREKYFM